MNEHIEKLLSVCREATQGEWRHATGENCSHWVDSPLSTVAIIPTESVYCAPETSQNARHITTFQPRNVEKLLAAVSNLVQAMEPIAGLAVAEVKEALEQLAKEAE